MTAAVYRSGTPLLSVPKTQNTAPVLEFNCLYTHDTRRKQKRWKDGFLRFHTFNKRIMVYDVSRNLVGDVHWTLDGVLQDGDEVTLERDGVLVQVAESIGSTETDLTELRRSKKKTSSEAGSSSPARAVSKPAVSLATGSKPQPVTQLKHRSLNALLGPPKGPIGKAALGSESPFEDRHANTENEEWSSDRAAKRRRVDEPPEWNVTRTTTTATSASKKDIQYAARPSNTTKRKKMPLEAGQRKLGTREIVDLSVDDDDSEKFMAGFSSDELMPPSSPQNERAPAKPAVPVRSSSPAFQTQKAPEKVKPPLSVEKSIAVEPAGRSKKTEKAQSSKVVTKPRPPAQPTNPVKRPLDPLNGYLTQPPKEDEDAQLEASDSARQLHSKSGKTLRMNANAPKKKTLLCQEQVSKKPSRTHSANTENAIDVLLDVTSQEGPVDKSKVKSQRRQLQERLAKIGEKHGGGTAADSEDVAQKANRISAERGTRRTNEETLEAPILDAAAELARLDQMIMPPTRSPSPQAPVAPSPISRQLRRVVSETSNVPYGVTKRLPGAPVRYTPSPKEKNPDTAIQKESTSKEQGPPRPVTALPPKTRSKNSLQRSVSLNTAPKGTSAVVLDRPFRAPGVPTKKTAAAPENPPDPWSREAFDLFTWRPPGWDEGGWCVKEGDCGVEAVS